VHAQQSHAHSRTAAADTDLDERTVPVDPFIAIIFVIHTIILHLLLIHVIIIVHAIVVHAIIISLGASPQHRGAFIGSRRL
jgi:hypothetical protein